MCIKQKYPDFDDYQYVVEDGNSPSGITEAVVHGGRKHTTVKCQECKANHTYIGIDTSVSPQQAAIGWIE